MEGKPNPLNALMQGSSGRMHQDLALPRAQTGTAPRLSLRSRPTTSETTQSQDIANSFMTGLNFENTLQDSAITAGFNSFIEGSSTFRSAATISNASSRNVSDSQSQSAHVNSAIASCEAISSVLRRGVLPAYLREKVPAWSVLAHAALEMVSVDAASEVDISVEQLENQGFDREVEIDSPTDRAWLDTVMWTWFEARGYAKTVRHSLARLNEVKDILLIDRIPTNSGTPTTLNDLMCAVFTTLPGARRLEWFPYGTIAKLGARRLKTQYRLNARDDRDMAEAALTAALRELDIPTELVKLEAIGWNSRQGKRPRL